MSTRTLTLILTVVIVYSCNHHEENKNSTVSIDSTNTARTDTSPATVLNYADWEMFWTAFTTAALKKDTVIIVQLTNFPFLQNGSQTDRREFTELWISQTYAIRKRDTPVLSSELLLKLGEHEKAGLPKFDDVHYTNSNHKDFYFAKVNGYYKLIEIITPG